MALVSGLKGNLQVSATRQRESHIDGVPIKASYDMPARVQVELLFDPSNEAACYDSRHWFLIDVQCLKPNCNKREPKPLRVKRWIHL
jgi:hypothetical protein